MSSEPTLSWPVKVLLLSLPTILLLLVAEWLAGVYLKSRFDDFDLATQGTGEMAPNEYQLWAHPASYTNWIGMSRYNNLGFRELEDTSIEKAPGTIRIFVMGGSGALGSAANRAFPFLRMSGQAQYSPNETISSYLEAALSERYPDRRFEVINAATNWSQLHQQLIHYLRKVRSLEPDLVISIDGQNDAIPIRPSFLNMWEQSRTEKLGALNDNFRVKMRPLITHSNLLFLVAAVAFAEKDSGQLPVDQALIEDYLQRGKPADFDQKVERYMRDNRNAVERGVDEYLRHLQYFRDVTERDGVRTMFVLQPELIMDQTKPLTDRERAIKNFLYEDSSGYEVNFFALVERRGLELRSREGLPFWSFLQVFPDQTGEVYVDYTHLTPRGNRALAEELVRAIETEHPQLLSSTTEAPSPSAQH